MKNLKYLTLVGLFAIIRSSEVKEVTTHYHGAHTETKLCATFDIYNNGTVKIGSSEQCGENWEWADAGIRRQLKEKQDELDAEAAKQNYLNNLQVIKDKEIGKKITL